MFLGFLFAGFCLGLLEWTFDLRRVGAGDTLAAHLAWRTFSSTLTATACGLIA